MPCRSSTSNRIACWRKIPRRCSKRYAPDWARWAATRRHSRLSSNCFIRPETSTQTNEVSELLAHASVQAATLPRPGISTSVWRSSEPQNAMHMQNYQQVVGMMGGSSSGKLLTVEEGIVLVEELEATAPPVDQEYSPEIANVLRAALTDTELFVSYNMPDKALGPLMAVLPIAPSDVRLNQRLAALYTRSQRFSDAAACCRTLATVYAEAGLSEEASRYGDLAKRCGERSSTSPVSDSAEGSVADAPAAPWPAVATSETFAETESQNQEFDAQADVDTVEIVEPEFPANAGDGPSEIDLSEEWDGALTAQAPADMVVEESAGEASTEPAVEEIAAETDAVAETIEEVRFYLDHSMADQARAAFRKLQTLTAEDAQIAALREEINAAGGPGTGSEPSAGQAAEEIEVGEESHISEHDPHEHPEEVSPIQQMVADLDASLGEGFLPDTVTHEIEHDSEAVAHAASEPALVSHLEFMAGPKLESKEPPADESKVAHWESSLPTSNSRSATASWRPRQSRNPKRLKLYPRKCMPNPLQSSLSGIWPRVRFQDLGQLPPWCPLRP